MLVAAPNNASSFTVIDANGLDWTLCLFVNTTTGRLVRFMTDRGEIIRDSRGVPVQEILTVASPVFVTEANP